MSTEVPVAAESAHRPPAGATQMNLTSDKEILEYLKMRAETSGIPLCHISVWVHLEKDPQSNTLKFYVKSGDITQSNTGFSEDELDTAIEKSRATIKPEPIARRDKARELRQRAEEMMNEADRMDSSEITAPPAVPVVPPVDAPVLIGAAPAKIPDEDIPF